MTLELVIDNDVLIKASRYDLLGQMLHLDCSADCPDDIAVLGTARFVVQSRLQRSVEKGDASQRALDAFAAAHAILAILEPDDRELELATAIEDAAIEHNLELDAGESQLFAIAIVRGDARVLTGDKRAMVALRMLHPHVDGLEELRERVICLEQAMHKLAEKGDPLALRTGVCADPKADATMRICFSCTAPVVAEDFFPGGLSSYIDHLREKVGDLLAPGNSPDFR